MKMELGKKCPICKKGTIVLRGSIYGKFGGCSNYPRCRATWKLIKPEQKLIKDTS